MIYDNNDRYEFKKIHTLYLKHKGYYRGRSAGVQQFTDCYTGSILNFSSKGIALMFKGLEDGSIRIENGEYIGNFKKLKQGSNARWLPVLNSEL